MTNRLRFDIPAQELGAALNEYSRLTGLAVMIDSAHARRLAGVVQGTYTSMEALLLLLDGTGLRARRADSQSVVISPAPGSSQASAAPPVAASRVADIPGITGNGPDLMSYVARVQASIRGVLCASPQTRPGPYRLALQVRLDARGVVERLRLLDTTGQPARDTAISKAISSMAVGMPPPATMAQPVSILLLPDGPSAKSKCPSGDQEVWTASLPPGALGAPLAAGSHQLARH